MSIFVNRVKEKKKNKYSPIGIRILEEEKKKIQAMADARDKTMADFFRDLVEAEYERTGY